MLNESVTVDSSVNKDILYPKTQTSTSISPNIKNIVLVVAVLGVLMSAIDSTIVVLALPNIDSALQTSAINSVWVIMGYILVITVISTQVGKLGDNFGRARMFNLGFLIFIIGSALCVFSLDVYQLIFFRLLQGVGGALISSNSGAIISDYFDRHERGRAFGYTAVGWNVGAILGIILGGLLADFDWRLIFLINVPIGILILPIAFIKVKDIVPKLNEKLDLIGSALLGISLLIISYMSVYIIGSGFDTLSFLMLAISIAFALFFILREHLSKSPILDLSLFKSKIFAFSVIAAMLQFTASFAVLFLLTIYLQGALNLDPLHASLYLLPGYVLGAFLAPFMGRLSDKYGARILATTGLIATGIGYLLYIGFLFENSPAINVSIITILTGLGSAMFFPANSSAIMAHAPQGKYGMASGTTRMLNNVGMVLSFAIALSIASLAIPSYYVLQIFVGSTTGLSNLSPTAGRDFVNGLHAAFFASFITIIIAAVMSAVRGKEDRRSLNPKYKSQPLEVS